MWSALHPIRIYPSNALIADFPGSLSTSKCPVFDMSLSTSCSELGVPRADVGELASRIAWLVCEESPCILTSGRASCWGVFLLDQSCFLCM